MDRLRRLLPSRGAVVGIVLLLLVLCPVWYGVRYHSLAFWAAPPRIPYCDCVYNLSGEPGTAASLGMSSAGPAASGLSSIGRVIPLVGYPLWADVASEESRAASGTPCTMAIYLEKAPGLYQAYALSGGP